MFLNPIAQVRVISNECLAGAIQKMKSLLVCQRKQMISFILESFLNGLEAPRLLDTDNRGSPRICF